MKSTQIAPQLTIEEIVDNRNEVLSNFNEGVKLITKSIELSKEFVKNGAYLPQWDNRKFTEFKQDFDRKVWRHLFQISGTSHFMNAEQKEAFEQRMSVDVPEVTVEAVKATLMLAKQERGETFVKGLIGTLQGVCKSYKSNKSFCIDKKLIFSGINGWGQYASRMKDSMVDIERMIHIANNEQPPKIGLKNSIYDISGTAGIKEFKYFTVRTYLNGNAHLVITCKGTINKLNDMIADYYQGSALAG